jgi:hypothetical protein
MDHGIIFNKILQKEKNEPFNFDIKSQKIIDKVNKIRNLFEEIHINNNTFVERNQIIKAKEKEEKYKSSLDPRQRKNFMVKKKLFELLSPFDEIDRRLNDIIVLATDKNLEDIFKLNSGKNKKLFELIRLKRRKALGNVQPIELDDNSVDNKKIDFKQISNETNIKNIKIENNNNQVETFYSNHTTRSNFSNFPNLPNKGKMANSILSFYNAKKQGQPNKELHNTTNNYISTICMQTTTNNTKSNFFMKNTNSFSTFKKQIPVNKASYSTISESRKDVMLLIKNHKIEQEKSNMALKVNRSNPFINLQTKGINSPVINSPPIGKFFSSIFVN